MTEYSRLITSNLISSEIKLNCKKGVWIFNPFKSFSYFSFFAFSVAIAPRLTTTDDPSTDDFFECDCELNEQCRFGCLDDDQSWVESYLREIMNSQSSFARSFMTALMLTAGEVILGVAIIMGLAALVTVLLRVCTRSRNPRNGQNISNIPNVFGRPGTRVSLTSLQQRVMSKLRDRPPRYETRHNYEYQRRDRNTRIPVLNPGAAIAPDLPPPSYENNDNTSVSAVWSIKDFPLTTLTF